MPKQKNVPSMATIKALAPQAMPAASNVNKKVVSRGFLKLVLKQIMPTAAIMPTSRAMPSPADKIITQAMMDIKTIDCK